MIDPNLEQIMRDIASRMPDPRDVIDQKKVERHIAYQQPPKGIPSPEEYEARSRYQVEQWEREDAMRPQNTPIPPPLHKNGTMLLYPPEMEAEDAKNAWRRRKAAGEKEWYDQPADPRAYLFGQQPINPDINQYLRPAVGPPAPMQQPTPMPEPTPAPEPVVAAPEPEPTPAPEAPPDDGRIRTAIGDFQIGDDDIAKIFNERTGRFHPTTMTSFPSEVTAAMAARKAAKSAAPGEILDGEDRYKVDGGKTLMFHPKSGSWIEMGSEDLPSMPESVRKAYVDSRSAMDKDLSSKIHDVYYGSTQPRPEQIEENKAKIQTISDSMSENQGLQGISSPEQLQAAREQANAALQAAQKTGNASAIKSLKEHADQLNNMQVISTPEGGYMAVVKLDGDYKVLHTATPKEPKKTGQYDWTKDPQQVASQAQAMAIVDNRDANSKASGGAMLSRAGRTIMDTFAGRYAKDYRADQLRGEQPSEPAPEVLVEAYVKAREAGDQDGMLEAVKEMQKGLASRYGDIYNSVRPSFIKPGTINEGVMDFSPALVPQQPDRGWNVTSQLLSEKQGKMTPETKLELPDIFGAKKDASDAQFNVQNNFTAQQPTALSRVQEHKAQLLKNPTEMIGANGVRPRTAGGRELDQPNTPSSLLKVSVEDKVKTDRVFADKLIGSVMNGVAAKVGAIKLATMNSGVSESTNADDKTTKRVKGPTISKDKEKEILKSLFGVDTKGETSITVLDNGKPVRINLSDPGAMQIATQQFLQLPRAEQEKMMQQGSYWKTIGMLDGLHPKMVSTGKGVAPKRHNGRLEIDSQLGDLAGTEIMNASAGLFEEMARELIKQNPEYYRRNAITGNGNANYRPQDVIDALAKNLAQESMIETFTPSMR